MKEAFEQIKFIRAIGLSIEDDGLGFIHDYGEENLPWDSITHSFAVILKKQKLPFPTLFIMKKHESGTLYYIDGNTVSSKYFKIRWKSDRTGPSAPQLKKSPDDFIKLLMEICLHFTSTYIDKPLIAFLRSGSLFLPTLSNMANVSDYCLKIVNTITVKEKERAPIFGEDELRKVSAPTREREEWSEGTVIEGQYAVQEILRGGMGTVYIAFDSENVKWYAIKTFQERYLWDDRVIKQFIREAEIWIKLDRHPNIVLAELVRMIDGQPYIFLEYVQGTDLEKLMNRESLTVRQSLEFAIQFCEGMHYAYRKLGLIHRDIKPSNCLITREGILKITDFGLGKIFDKSHDEGELVSIPQKARKGKTTSSSTTMAGTLPFMAPELFENLRAAGIRTDIYSFGIVLYMMLTGTNPFFCEDVSELIIRHISHVPDRPVAVNPRVPESLSNVVLKCLAKEPGDRYEDFSLLKTELESIYRTACGVPYIQQEAESTFSEEDWINKGLSLASLYCYREAIITFDQALLLNPRSIKALIHKGVSLMSSGKILEAISCLDECITIEPYNWEPWLYMGDAHSKLGNNFEALLCFDRALELTDENAIILGRKGKFLADAGKLEEALQCYDLALTQNPRIAEIWDEKGALFITIRSFEAALEALKEALGINPRLKQSWYHQGIALFNLGFFSEAISSQQKALVIDPEFASALVNIGDCHRELGNREEALEAYRSALRIQPENLEAYFSAILLLKEESRWEEALRLLDQALEIGPDHPGLLMERAETLLHLGYYEDSLSICQLIKEIDPGNEEAQLISRTIGKLKGEQEAIFHRIPPAASSPAEATWTDFDSLMSLHCGVDSALRAIEERGVPDSRACYLKACLYFIKGDYASCSENLGPAMGDQAVLSPAISLANLVEERLEEQKGSMLKKKGRLKSLFRKTGKEGRSIDELLILGLERLEGGAWMDAAAFFQEAISIDPTKHSARFFLGKAYLMEGLGDKALQSLDDFYRYVPDSIGYWREKTDLLRMSNPVQVEEIYHQWISKNPENHIPWILYLAYLSEKSQYRKVELCASGLLRNIRKRLKSIEKTEQLSNVTGVLQLLLGRFDEARAAFSKTLSSEPDNSTALMGLGMSCQSPDLVSKAREAFTGLLAGDSTHEIGSCLLADLYRDGGNYVQALRLLEDALKKQGASIALMQKKAQVLVDSKNYVEFFNYYDQIYSMDTGLMSVKTLRALALYESQKTDDAIMELINILSIDQYNITALRNLGYLYIQSLNFHKAITHFDEILSVYPLDFEAHMGKGIASYLMKDYDQAGKSFHFALELNPTDPELWEFLGAYHFHLKSFSDSAKCWDRAIHYRSRFTQAWINKGIFLYEIKEYTQAQGCADRALRMDPENSAAWICRSRCQWNLGNTDEALRSAEKAISLSPQSIKGWMLRGVLAFHQKNYELSRQSFEKATQVESKIAELWYNRALLTLYLKREQDAKKTRAETQMLTSEAKKSLSRAMALKPDFLEGFIAQFILEGFTGGIAQRHTFLARAQGIDPEKFRSWADKYEDSRDPLAPLRPLELSEDLFELPINHRFSLIEPREVMHYLKRIGI